MQLISNRYISTEEVRNLTVGSYEHLIARIEEAARAESAQLFGTRTETQVVGTFSGYAIVLSEDGRFVRLKYEDRKGVVKILSHEAVKVPSFTPDKLDGYLKTEAEKAAESFLKGDTTKAVDRLRGLLSFVERKVPQQDERIVEAMILFHRSERPWKKIFQEKADAIRRMTLDEIAAIHEDRLQPKFRSIYAGWIDEADFEKYREVVIDSLRKIENRADSLRSQVEAALSEIGELKLTDGAVVALQAFGEDLADDLRTTRKVVHEAQDPQRLSQVPQLGRLHDAFAEDFRNRELAGRFVMKMAKRLSGTRNVDSTESF